jgi:hypothetical protein
MMIRSIVIVFLRSPGVSTEKFACRRFGVQPLAADPG